MAHLPTLDAAGQARLSDPSRSFHDRVLEAIQSADTGGYALEAHPLPWGGVRLVAVAALDDECVLRPISSFLDLRAPIPPGEYSAAELVELLEIEGRAHEPEPYRVAGTPGVLGHFGRSLRVEIEGELTIREVFLRIGAAAAQGGGFAGWTMGVVSPNGCVVNILVPDRFRLFPLLDDPDYTGPQPRPDPPVVVAPPSPPSPQPSPPNGSPH